MVLSSNSTFVKTEIAVWQNSTKSLLFRAAELLLVLAVWKLFSLLAALQNRFTSYLIFSEGPLQKAHFVFSRRLSKDAILVAFFTLVYTAAQLYGSLLWALDAPGYVVRTERAPASSVSPSFLDNPEYQVSYTVAPNSLNLTDAELAEALSVNLFRPGTNISLTGTFDQGKPETVPPPRLGAGPRIWLDSEGWSVTTDGEFHVIINLGLGEAGGVNCPYVDLNQSTRFYSCDFDNQWTPILLEQIIGIPQVHYNEEADSQGRWGNIQPPRDDIWSSLGRSSGAAVRVHMFTVTKGYRRHTFVSTIAKASIVSRQGRLPKNEMRDLMRRVSVMEAGSSTNAAVDQDINLVLEALTAAESNNKSAAIGWVIGVTPNQLSEGFLEMLLMDSYPGTPVARLFRFTSVNITLVRSETISTPPVPFGPCPNAALQNEAYGGKVVDTDCVGSADLVGTKASYFGQVDTSAVLNLNGLHTPPYASSKEALDPVAFPWVTKNAEKLTNLVLSRGYILGLDPNLVTLELTSTTPGISYLQLCMVLLAAVLAVGSWGILSIWVSGHWSSSFLVNLITVTQEREKREPGFVCDIPEIKLVKEDGCVELRTETAIFSHQVESLPSPMK
ncbi:hypothetical protein QBC38DRAFT_429518 [Podospora fimiseda]|uniref:Uncharacterized protein n=1 Tax=Podospora fimiseda TaxID=252190 RepID=A0AAN7BCX6_9PEZI|nr:hypothetical protein QBC38DRAFT_429518 [Podospora fimiseda]